VFAKYGTFSQVEQRGETDTMEGVFNKVRLVGGIILALSNLGRTDNQDQHTPTSSTTRDVGE